ncbi:lanthionine synthetase C family protein [Hyalangium versicolor]|uniref:lanthionine synthetase C family protein n=1 Tax=Hyalangium versicolor TaxID=2861190 RepID=UPI001CC96345|nr:lanthionine synthetase C family protein [Hyalangium versicolor]
MVGGATSPWTPVLEPALAARAVAVARETCARMRDFRQVERAAETALAQSAFPEVVRWRPLSVSGGSSGLAVLASYMEACFPGETWDTWGHQHLALAKGEVDGRSEPAPGLFAGVSGLAFGAWLLARGGSRYRKLLGGLEEWLLPRVESDARALAQEREGLAVHAFDAISGLAGVAAYLLCRRQEPAASACLREVLQALCSLAVEDGPLPRWHTPSMCLGPDEQKQTPYGNLNCGLAHGIPGPLAVLSLALSSGVEVEGLRASVERLAAWLAAQRVEEEWGVNWPYSVPLAAPSPELPAPQPTLPSRAAWCYGSPGVARALWLAGQALGRAEHQELALSAMEAVYRKPVAARHIDSPTLCHGVAGLLQITLRFAHDTRMPHFKAEAATLTEQLLGQFDPARPLGYYSLEPGGRVVDDPGFLDGAAGVPLTLLAAATAQEPVWDRLLLLS